MAEITGLCDARFGVVEELLSASIDAGRDLGASVALTIDGRRGAELIGAVYAALGG